MSGIVENVNNSVFLMNPECTMFPRNKPGSTVLYRNNSDLPYLSEITRVIPYISAIFGHRKTVTFLK